MGGRRAVNSEPRPGTLIELPLPGASSNLKCCESTGPVSEVSQLPQPTLTLVVDTWVSTARRRRLQSRFPKCRYSLASTSSPSMLILISLLTMNLPSSIISKFMPKSLRLISPSAE
jgi:hypothetical protein